MPYQRNLNRNFWSLFLATWMFLSLFIRWHVIGLDRQVAHEGLSNAAIVACRDVLLDHVDIETGLRGFLIVGNRDFLRPYHEGLGRLDRDTARLRVAVAGIAGERPYFDSMLSHSEAILTEFNNQVATSDANGVDSGRQRFLQFPTKPGMDKIRQMLLEIQSEEDRRLTANMASLERSLATTIFLINAFAIVSGFLMVAMLFGFISPPEARHQPTPPPVEGR